MSRVEKRILQPADGTNQLGEYIGQPKEGDTIAIHYIGRLATTKIGKDGQKMIVPGKKFVDTNLIGQYGNKMAIFQLTKKASEQHGLYRGLNEAIPTMLLGEVAEFFVPSGIRLLERKVYLSTMKPMPA